jgi:hypothetical protein
MVMFKAKSKPLTGKPAASNIKWQAQQQQQPQPVPQPGQDERKAPPIEKERGPQYPVKEPGPGNPPERAR